MNLTVPPAADTAVVSKPLPLAGRIDSYFLLIITHDNSPNAQAVEPLNYTMDM